MQMELQMVLMLQKALQITLQFVLFCCETCLVDPNASFSGSGQEQDEGEKQAEEQALVCPMRP